ncbi:glycerophosphodiester phosphodiesterase [Rothia amarae]|uniref:glycerophosphodiester phosphodiesterase n=1 Tax=Rothia amarae TaxID=169480 RepID=UPI000928F858|nr:glycerophosphoryl diester phosphodiesterase GlpQ2 [Mycobacteroides abscessus subsp. abscessus]
MNTFGKPVPFTASFEPFAHRGFALDVPENTIAAFQKAAALGVRWMEIDVHTTSDGVVIVFHDSTLNRMVGISGKVCDKTWTEIQAFDLPGGHKIPTLEQTLVELPELFFNIDVKDDASAQALPEVVAKTGAINRVRIASFSEKRRAATVKKMRALAPDSVIKTSASELAMYGFYVAAHTVPALWPVMKRLASPFFEDFESMQIPLTYKFLGKNFTVVTPQLVQTAHRFGLTVQVWTIDNPQVMRDLLKIGVDGIVTNRSDVLREVLDAA